jgi:hypothetical protein
MTIYISNNNIIAMEKYKKIDKKVDNIIKKVSKYM